MAKTAVAKRSYMNGDGDDTRTPTAKTSGLKFTFANGKVLTVEASGIHADVSEMARWHGVNQKIGDAFAGAKGDADAAYEAAKSMAERIAEGTWVTTRESAGPSTGLLVEAIVRAKTAAGEKADTFTDARKAEIAVKLKGETPKETQEKRAGALANPAIKAAFEAIKAERAVAKAKAAAGEAKGQTADLSGF